MYSGIISALFAVIIATILRAGNIISVFHAEIGEYHLSSSRRNFQRRAARWAVSLMIVPSTIDGIPGIMQPAILSATTLSRIEQRFALKGALVPCPTESG